MTNFFGQDRCWLLLVMIGHLTFSLGKVCLFICAWNFRLLSKKWMRGLFYVAQRSSASCAWRFDGEYFYCDGGSWLDYSAAVARNLLKWQKVVENRGHFN